jgi:hypothetical protein
VTPAFTGVPASGVAWDGRGSVPFSQQSLCSCAVAALVAMLNCVMSWDGLVPSALAFRRHSLRLGEQKVAPQTRIGKGIESGVADVCQIVVVVAPEELWIGFFCKHVFQQSGELVLRQCCQAHKSCV